MAKNLKNPIAVWDITISIESTNYTRDDVVEIFNENFKKWCFQLEKGENGYLHYQCRVSTFKKNRKAPMIKGVHPDAITPTSLANKDNDFYVMKEETRIEGPWSDRDNSCIITRQMKEFNISGWMLTLIEKIKDFDLRTIDVIYDIYGNNGKSLFTEYMETVSNTAEEIPPFRAMEDIFQWVHGRPKKPIYLIDMPRGMKKDKLAEFYSGIEVIKNGVAYDKRHYPKKTRFDRPRICVFTNHLPVFELLSADRWKVWMITMEGELQEYEDGEGFCEVSSSEED